MKRYFRYLGPVLVTAIFLGAIYLLYHKLKAYSIEEIRASVQQIDNARLVASVGLMIVNYMILVGYDWLALLAIHKRLPLPRVGLVSFVGQAVSYNFGALLGGTTVRYRFYSAWGFKLEEIVRLVLMLAVTFWVGALGLCGIVFLIAPPAIPAELLEKMPIHDVRVLGGILLCIALSYLVMCFFVRKPLHVFGKEFVFPPPRIAIAQALVAGIDLIAAAACMYVLLPGDMGIGFIDFLPGYLMAQVAVVLTHVPGGVGVFELVILHLTHTPREQVVVAAVLCFRVIYFILPLLAAAVLLAIYEARVRRDALHTAGRWLSVLSHSIAAWGTFVAGVVLLFTTVLPTSPPVLKAMNTLVPHWLSTGAHWLCACIGASLLFLAYGLEQRQAAVWRGVNALFAGALLCLFLKGFNWGVALMLGVIWLQVFMARRRFYRNSMFWETPIPLRWLWPSWVVLASVWALAYALYAPKWSVMRDWTNLTHYDAASNLHTVIGVTIVLGAAWLVRLVLHQLWRRRYQPGSGNKTPRG